MTYTFVSGFDKPVFVEYRAKGLIVMKMPEFHINSPAGGVAKYCNEHVCVCICLSVCPLGYFPNDTLDFYQIFCILPIVMARSSSGR